MVNPFFRARSARLPVRIAVMAVTVALLAGTLGPPAVAAAGTPPPREADGSREAGETASPIYAPTGLLAQRVLQDPKKEEDDEEEKDDEKAIPEEVTFEEPSQPKRTSPALAFLFSAAAPGAGQVYNGNRRALAYVAVEAVAWIAHFSFRSSGNQKQDEFEEYADTHWDYDRWFESHGDSIPGGGTCEVTTEADSLIRHFRENDRQHYYEDIGKLSDYQCGWDTAENRETYRDLREDSNSLKAWSRRSLMLVFLNHLVSGFDAFRTARSRQMELGDGTRLQMDIDGRLERPRAVLRLVHAW